MQTTDGQAANLGLQSTAQDTPKSMLQTHVTSQLAKFPEEGCAEPHLSNEP